jgi:hypothetical protein
MKGNGFSQEAAAMTSESAKDQKWDMFFDSKVHPNRFTSISTLILIIGDAVFSS